MNNKVKSALFIYNTENSLHCDDLIQNDWGVLIDCIDFDTFLINPQPYLDKTAHVIVAGNMEQTKAVFKLALDYPFSLGLLANNEQKQLLQIFELPKKLAEQIDLALQKYASPMDIILCNDKVVLSKAHIGWIPLLDAHVKQNPFNGLFRALKRLHGLQLLQFEIKTANQQHIKTAASGCMLVQHHRSSTASSLINHDSSSVDGAISLVIVSPYSIIEYLKFLFRIVNPPKINNKQLPSSIGYIKSSEMTIDCGGSMNVYIDGELATHTPLFCETKPKAIRVNAGAWLKEENQRPVKSKESLKIANLPDDKERLKTQEKNVPFFSYASEERFKDLFLALREDAQTDSIYIVLMLLSTLLASAGLYQSSPTVIIGAMLLAPLMAPIVSTAMGLLRQDQNLLSKSANKILIGLFIALSASALLSFSFPYKPITAEMQGRLNPTLLDLAIAIISGIAAAYSKSHKKILQSLAGVAIAVALVPPLAVAGIGLGRGDSHFFLQAFLLFSTNLIGIILSATLTFRILGFSQVVRHKRGILFVLLSLFLIAVPLNFSYEKIVDDLELAQRLQTKRFLVNGKYIILQKAKIVHFQDHQVIETNLLVREPLTRDDLYQLNKKINFYAEKQWVIHTQVRYIL